MTAKKPLVVFVFATERSNTSTRYGGFASRLQKAGGLKGKDVLTVALENLLFMVHEDMGADVIDTVSGRSLGEADFVYMKSIGEETAALATFLFHKGIPFMDTAAYKMDDSKLTAMFRMWAAGIRVPFSLYVRNSQKFNEPLVQEAIKQGAGEKFIFKDIWGEKGRNNFHITQKEIPATLEDRGDIRFMVQRFIENDGDFRVGVYANKARIFLKRKGADGSHLNNTSAGGEAAMVEGSSIPKGMKRLAEKAAKAVDLQIAGVDVIIDKQTSTQYILEVNLGSQIVTGAYTAEKIRAFNEALDEVIKKRYVKPVRKPLAIVGRRAVASLPELGISEITAKLDTGAYTSSLHAENIREEYNEIKGAPELVFTLKQEAKVNLETGVKKEIRTSDYFTQKVRSSNGQQETRYSIRTKIVIEGMKFIITLTLTDRSKMGYPLLIGRRAQRSRFMVNVELNEKHETRWKF